MVTLSQLHAAIGRETSWFVNDEPLRMRIQIQAIMPRRARCFDGRRDSAWDTRRNSRIVFRNFR